MKPRRLTRADGRPAAPVRSVHVGLGNFFKAHQAAYAEHAADADSWGIAAFTGRSPHLAEVMSAQECVYTLLQRGAEGDHAEVISSVSAAHASDDGAAWQAAFESPDLSFVTMTITESAYRAEGEGVMGRLVRGLQARRDCGGAPLAIVPCDNLPTNGALTRALLLELATSTPGLASWIDDNISFVNTLVDRITPAPAAADRAEDPALVVTEPFSEWVIEGEFPAGHPAWPGVHWVADIEPWQQRKLWLLNGAHTLMALTGQQRGHTTVSEAIADSVIRGWVERWWDECTAHLTMPPDELHAYRANLLTRFANPRLPHRLDQIASDSTTKLMVRVLPVLRAELAAGREPDAALIAVAAWVAADDPRPTRARVAALLGELDLAEFADVPGLILDRIGEVSP